MKRKTGIYITTSLQDEKVSAFVPFPLPPRPPVRLTPRLKALLESALHHCGLLNVASLMVPDRNWFIYGFVRKEAVVSSQIEGTQATLLDVLQAESVSEVTRDPDIEEITNYVAALNYSLGELKKPKGLPISLRLIREAHRRLMQGERGGSKGPGEFRRSQNWIGGTRPGNARFVPPPPGKLTECLAAFEQYVHTSDAKLHPMVRAALLHVQFESIHPFLDGNGRVGRLLITLLLSEWKILEAPLLYVSLYFKQHRSEYYDRLMAVRDTGDFEGWIEFFLTAVADVAQQATTAARTLFSIVDEERGRLLVHKKASVASIRLLEILPAKPIVTMPQVAELLGVTKPTAQKAIEVLVFLRTLEEVSGKERGRRFAFQRYLKELSAGTELL